ncbi:MAG: sulfite exporter TauE/SafE family protein [Candidatus Peribacteraceae bacterium]|nr:sulfite exporter TauE/SafE family protein [Candidatus Peribacteraceae bacterium]
MEHTSKHLELIELRIAGMHCRSCEIILERALKGIPGVAKSHVNSAKGTAKIYADPTQLPSMATISAAIEEAGYSVVAQDASAGTVRGNHADTSEISGTRKWLEIGAALIIILALYQVLKGLGITDFASSVSGTATLGGVFLIGIVAGLSSCLAVTGGLLLSVTGKWNELHPDQDGWTKFKPLLAFNIGRLASYFVLGGVIGLIGTSISLSPQAGGYLSIAVALVMLSLALSMLRIIPKGSCPIRPPKRLAHWIADMSEHPHPAAPFFLGGLTFFLPCGFTQSLQLVALASGSFTMGALIMFSFALGTLPALLGLSVISATAKGTYSRVFLRFVGTLVLLLSLWNLRSGLTLVGVDAASLLSFGESATDAAYAKNADPNVTIAANGDQIINMRVDGYEYTPDTFTVEAGRTTWVYADADRITGCTSILTVPKFGLQARLQQGEQVRLGPIRNPTSDFFITCSMGMVSARVRVIQPGVPGSQAVNLPLVEQASAQEDPFDAPRPSCGSSGGCGCGGA